MKKHRHYEKRSDVAIHEVRGHGLPRYARNDEQSGNRNDGQSGNRNDDQRGNRDDEKGGGSCKG